MNIFHGFDSLPTFHHSAVTVGSYDGVHGGHKVLLEKVCQEATIRGGESIVLTFEPHPRITLGTDAGLQLLTTLPEKANLLTHAGINNLIVIPFNTAFSQISSQQFVQDYLIGKVHAETLVVGYNHHFGHDKEGNYDYLNTLHTQFGFGLTEVQEYDVASAKVSSTIIRQLIAAGDMAQATRRLGHPYLVIGDNNQGQIILSEPLKLLPKAGLYPVQIEGIHSLLTIDSARNLHVNHDLPKGEILITFDP